MKKEMVRLIIAAAILSIIPMLYASAQFGCERGSGNIVKEDRQVKRFTKVVLKSSGNVYIKQGTTASAQVETDDNIQKYIKIEFDGSTLNITSDVSICPKKLNFYLIMPEIELLNIKGSGNIGVKGPVNTDKIEIKIDGSGDIKIKDINAVAARLLINGSGDVEANGTIKSLSCNIKGSGDINFKDVKTQNCEVSIYGSGDVRVDVDENLDITILGSGDVIYSGNAQNIRQKVLGSGSVIKR